MGLILEARPCSAYSFALHHAGLAPLASIRVRNTASERSPATDAVACVDAISGRWLIRIPEIHPGDSVELAAETAEVDRDLLERTTRPAEGSLRLELGSDHCHSPILLLSPWQWPVFPEALPALAAYVLKHDGIVRNLISESRIWKPDAVLDMTRGVSHVSDPEGSMSALMRMFHHLSHNYHIAYAEPMITHHPSGAVFQDIRPPHRIIHNRRDCLGEATCIDLTLLIAGCLEGMGFATLLLLLFDSQDVPVHAFLGIWLRNQAHTRPVLRDSKLLHQSVKRGELLVIETTAMCDSGRKGDFEAAILRGVDHLVARRSIVALDVCALRPPMGKVLSMENPFDPVVLLALAEAAELARSLATPRFETLHILYGIVKAGGEISTRLLEQSLAGSASLEKEIVRILAARNRESPREPTVGYNRCISEAIENARSQGSTVVRECDMLWAVLRSRSRSVEAALENSGCPQTTLVPLLDALCPQSRSTTTIG